MHVTFYGATREVTGSLHLIHTDTDSILLDCGMFQGRRKESEIKNKFLPFDPLIITNVVLSHAHIDHCGRIPVLTKRGFKGSIFCTRATLDACKYLLLDSAKIQQSDADYLNYKTLRSLMISQGSQAGKEDVQGIKKLLKKGPHELNIKTIAKLIRKYRLDFIKPIYNEKDAENSLRFFEGYPYHEKIEIGKDVSCIFYDAGHILGSAVSIIKIRRNNRSYNICYTGDIGRFDSPVIKNPQLKFAEEDTDIDLLIMESTYGSREHGSTRDMAPLLMEVISKTLKKGGSVIIPSFAFGRTQEILYMLHELYDRGKLEKTQVYVDSPLASNLTKVFGDHPELYDQKTHKTFLERGENPFSFPNLTFVQSVEESIEIMQKKVPHIVIAASGMCEGGRILHHLRYKIHDDRNTILVVGYMAQNTLGRRILELGEAYEKSGRKGAPPVLKFLNKKYPLKAKVVELDNFSAHADKNELSSFVEKSNLKIKKIAVVHGEEEQSLMFAKHLETKGFQTIVPVAGQSVNL